MKRTPLRRLTPLRRASWFDEVAKLDPSLKRSPLQRKTRLKPRRSKPRKDGQFRSREHLNRVRELGYCSARVILGVTKCWGPIDPDHMGERPGMGTKASDLSAAPICRACHSARHDLSGPFKGMSREAMREFCKRAIDLCEYYLNAEALGGHGRRRSVA